MQKNYSAVNVILDRNDTHSNRLLLGDVHSLSNKQIMSQVLHIICCIKDYNPSVKLGAKHNKNILHLPLRDKADQDIDQYFEQAYGFIEEGLKSSDVLVHCFAGVSRSATIVISYLMKKKQLSVQNSIQFVMSRRSCICPNKGFMTQLRNYEDSLKAKPEVKQQKQILQSLKALKLQDEKYILIKKVLKLNIEKPKFQKP